MRQLRTQVLVVGAGPAGSVAAGALAGEGVDVVLVDRHGFPRDKACGDALIPDALKVLSNLSLKSKVLEKAVALDEIRIYAPNETFVSLPGEFACLPRYLFDDLLKDFAVGAGARFLPFQTLSEAVWEGQQVKGAMFRSSDNEPLRIDADVTLLATGAASGPLERFGVRLRREPSAFALRVYVEADPGLVDCLCISFNRDICPGYGWIFPCPGGTLNMGVGYFLDARRRPPTTNLHELLQRFLRTFPLARDLARAGIRISEPRGAPLRTCIQGSSLARDGLLVIGEAAGLTYSFSGEGIGKAMESGLMAAELVSEALRSTSLDLPSLAQAYSTRIRREWGPRFDAYRRAQDWLSTPLFANILAWKARRGGFARRQLEDLLQERGQPLSLFSPLGVLRGLLT